MSINKSSIYKNLDLLLFGKTNSGPKNNPVYIDSSDEFYKIFGKPNSVIYERKKKINKILKRIYENIQK